MEATRGDGLIVSDEPGRLDLDRVCAWLGASYWASDRDRDTIARSLAGSWCFGAYDRDGTQLALTRVVTDGVTFAWLCDVVVDEARRGQGIGGWLVGTVVAELEAQGVLRVALTTRDAHGVYARLGFEPVRVPETWMEIDRRRTRPAPGSVRPAR